MCKFVFSTPRGLLLFALLLVFCPFDAFAQAPSWTFSLRAGAIRTLQHERQFRDLPQHAPYVELQADKRIGGTVTTALQVRGGVSLGYWRDGVQQPSRVCRDCETYAYNSVNLGGRIGVFLNKAVLPVGFSAGVARHFLHRNLVAAGPLPATDRQMPDFNTADAAVQLDLPLSRFVVLSASVRQYIPLGGPELNIGRRSYTAGVTYLLLP